MSAPDDRTARIEPLISVLLIWGVALSLAFEVTGTVLYYLTYGNLDIARDPAVFIQGHDFFSFVYSVFSGRFHAALPLWFMTAGVIILVLTPFLRVVSSAVWFALARNFKYAIITLFVLIILTLSLILH